LGRILRIVLQDTPGSLIFFIGSPTHWRVFLSSRERRFTRLSAASIVATLRWGLGIGGLLGNALTLRMSISDRNRLTLFLGSTFRLGFLGRSLPLRGGTLIV